MSNIKNLLIVQPMCSHLSGCLLVPDYFYLFSTMLPLLIHIVSACVFSVHLSCLYHASSVLSLLRSVPIFLFYHLDIVQPASCVLR